MDTIRLIQQRLLNQVLHLTLKQPLPHLGKFASTNGRQPQAYIYDFDKEQPLYLINDSFSDTLAFYRYDDDLSPNGRLIIVGCEIISSLVLKSDSPINTKDDDLAEEYADEDLMTREEFDEALQSYETAHGMSSAEFYKKWRQGEMPDEIEFNMWAGLYEFSLEDGLVFKKSSSPQLEKSFFKLESVIERVGA